MIWYWLDQLLRKIIWLFKRPAPVALARINPNAKCPGCGAENGTLRAVNVFDGRVLTPKIQHRCNVCGARVFEDTVMKTTTEVLLPADGVEAVGRETVQ